MCDTQVGVAYRTPDGRVLRSVPADLETLEKVQVSRDCLPHPAAALQVLEVSCLSEPPPHPPPHYHRAAPPSSMAGAADIAA